MASEQELVHIDGNIDEIIAAGKSFAKGMSAKAVAAQYDISTQEAKKRYMQYKQMAIEAAKRGDLGERLAVAVEETMQHYDMLIEDAWENKRDAEANLDFSVVNTSLRLIKDINESRFKMLHQMTEGQDAELLEDLERMENRQEQLLQILKDMKKEFPDAAKWVYKRLRDEAEGVEVVQ